ncbi:methionyl-tRNA formyltransferase [Caloramator quimbayensis]|uniref:Methionyl-tRNA formyltransferase n=1 Tax=Caloramator quimbayensis TaxID=1147123 RepID=A0A1T4XTD0_9CLOT|nr:methionyl-tRNA formyltransferase [Caloramator quimbayensis]SKA92418.1 methionyl-tRNA formyltransferase [Caloramator quimbayensis]
MKAIFMGTPEFAVPTLKKLIEKHEVAAVFTQPDKPKGRGQKMQLPPVKETALMHNIPVYQPQKLKGDYESLSIIKEISPDVIVVVAFGQILPKEILDIPKFGCINVHASLLPQLRGAAPINWAIIRGYEYTGITTMKMDIGLDTGDMLLKEEVKIDECETAGELHDKLMYIGSELLIKTLDMLEKNQINPEKQDDSKSSYAPMLNKELGHIDWNKDANEVYNLIRGVIPWPGAYFFYDDKMIKVWKANKENFNYNTIGQIVEISSDGIKIACSKGAIIIKELQEVGGKRMDVSSYVNGHKIEKGKIVK